MPDTPRFFRYAVLAAMLPVAVLGVVTTPAEYRAIGIEAEIGRASCRERV